MSDLPPEIRAKVDEIKRRPGRHGPQFRTNLLELIRPRRLNQPDEVGPVPWVSAREAEVVELVADGRTNDEIANLLQISPDTVKSHLMHMLGRTESRNRAHLAARWARGELEVRSRVAASDG